MKNKIAIVVLGFVAMCLVGAAIIPPLRTNLVTEAIATAFTLLVLQRLISAAEAERTRPARLAALREAIRIEEMAVILFRPIIHSLATEDEKDTLSRAKAGTIHPLVLQILGRMNFDGDGIQIKMPDASEMRRSEAIILARFERVRRGVYENDSPEDAAFLQRVDIRRYYSWREMTFTAGNKLLGMIDRFMQRHVATCDPRIVEAIQNLESTDPLFSYRVQPWEMTRIGNQTIEPMWPEYLDTVGALMTAINFGRLEEADRLTAWQRTPSLDYAATFARR